MALHHLATLADLALPPEAIVIADANLPDALLQALPSRTLLRVTAGESLKSLSSIEDLAMRVLSLRASRPLILVGLGGGSIGDAVGFLASILWRGVELWHIPTTLLAMVDSAHGGKTAVNLGLAKNQLGTFYLPERVYLVDEILETLPLPQRREGLAEIVKAMWIGDREGLDSLDADGGVEALASAPFSLIAPRLKHLIERAIAVKDRVVKADPFETKGIRTVLNLGHTMAHALELEDGLSHGDAVAWGLAAVATLSEARGVLATTTADRLRRQLHPLLTSLSPGLMASTDALTFLLARDKKRQNGRLRSVLLEGPGAPFVTAEPTEADWCNALSKAYQRWIETPIRLRLEQPRHSAPAIGASKSVLNRLLAIAHLRPGITEIVGSSRADDVAAMERALAVLERAPRQPAVLECHEGGTTFRFLLAIAAARDAPTTLYTSEKLFQRPHGPLLDALRKGGAQIVPFSEKGHRHGFQVDGWKLPPRHLEVDVTKSSQYASAIAILAAAGLTLDLVLTPGRETMVSSPYFQMTLDLLDQTGVQTQWSSPNTLHLCPGPALSSPATFEAPADTSSVALWHTLRHLCPELDPTLPPLDPSQPDSAIVSILETLASSSPAQPVILDMTNHPDLTPVVCALSLLIEPEVHIRGAAHLRLKESNRIDDLASSLADVGLTIHPTDDGMRIPAGIQYPTSGALFDTARDHRLAMAALVLTTSGIPLHLARPAVVNKSYPNLWTDARQAGWSISPSNQTE